MLINTDDVVGWAKDNEVLSIGCCFVLLFFIVAKHLALIALGQKLEQRKMPVLWDDAL